MHRHEGREERGELWQSVDSAVRGGARCQAHTVGEQAARSAPLVKVGSAPRWLRGSQGRAALPIGGSQEGRGGAGAVRVEAGCCQRCR